MIKKIRGNPMKTVDRITITLPPEMAETVRAAVESGQYASNSEIIREALSDWTHKNTLRDRQLEALRKDVKEGLADVKAGKTRKFDPERIIKKGKKRLDKRAPSI